MSSVGMLIHSDDGGDTVLRISRENALALQRQYVRFEDLLSESEKFIDQNVPPVSKPGSVGATTWSGLGGHPLRSTVIERILVILAQFLGEKQLVARSIHHEFTGALIRKTNMSLVDRCCSAIITFHLLRQISDAWDLFLCPFSLTFQRQLTLTLLCYTWSAPSELCGTVGSDATWRHGVPPRYAVPLQLRKRASCVGGLEEHAVAVFSWERSRKLRTIPVTGEIRHGLRYDAFPEAFYRRHLEDNEKFKITRSRALGLVRLDLISRKRKPYIVSN